VETVLETHDRLPPGKESSHLDGILHRFGAAVDKESSLLVVAGSESVEPLGKRHVGLVRRDWEADVGEAVELLPNGAHNTGMTVPGVDNPDPPGEIDEPVAVSVGDDGALGVGHGDGSDRRNSAGDGLGPPRLQSAALRAGNLGHQMDHAGHERPSGLTE
jgi:hypothetical protein